MVARRMTETVLGLVLCEGDFCICVKLSLAGVLVPVRFRVCGVFFERFRVWAGSMVG